MSIKAQFNSDIKIIPATTSFNDFKNLVCQLFSIPTGKIDFHYIDSDSERITIESDQDLEAMISEFGGKTPKVMVSYEKPAHYLDSIGLT